MTRPAAVLVVLVAAASAAGCGRFWQMLFTRGNTAPPVERAAVERVAAAVAAAELDAPTAAAVADKLAAVDKTGAPDDILTPLRALTDRWKALAAVETDVTAEDAAALRAFLRDPQAAVDPPPDPSDARNKLDAAAAEVRRGRDGFRAAAGRYGVEPPAAGPSFLGQWFFAEPFDTGLMTGLYKVDADGTLTEFSAAGGKLVTGLGKWARTPAGIKVAWESGSTEEADVTAAAGGRRTYRITAHTGDAVQVGRSLTMTPFDDPDRMTAAVTLRNDWDPGPGGAVSFRLRWVAATGKPHEFGPWENAKLKHGESRTFTRAGGYHAEADFDFRLAEGKDEFRVDRLRVGVVSTRTRPADHTGPVYRFVSAPDERLDLVPATDPRP
jgi:hypothetical protein